MPPEQPAPTSPDYSFIMQNGPKKSGLNLPKLNLPTPVKIIGAVIVVLVLLVVITSSGGSGGPSLATVNVAARQHEIIRVSNLAQANLQDQQAKNLEANVLAVMTTEQSQLIKSLGVKSADGRLNRYRSSVIDDNLQTATQNNNYDSTYLTYIKQALTTLAQQIQAAQAATSGNAASQLKTDQADVQTLLASPQLTNL